MSIEEFLGKIAALSESKGPELYASLLAAVQIEAAVQLALSILFLCAVLWCTYSSRAHAAVRKLIAKVNDSDINEGVLVLSFICLGTFLMVSIIASTVTLLSASTYVALFNPEGYILSNTILRSGN